MTLTPRDPAGAARAMRSGVDGRRLSQAEFYRAEVARLRDMAASPAYREVRAGLLCVAREYELLAEQRVELDQHRFGEPFQRPVVPDGYPAAADHAPKSSSSDRDRKG